MPRRKKAEREMPLAVVATALRAGMFNETMANEIAARFKVSFRTVYNWRRTVLDRWQAESDLLGESGRTADILARIRQDALDAKADKEHGAVVSSRKLEAQVLCLGQFQPPPSTVTHEFKTPPTEPPTREALLADLAAIPADVLLEAASKARGEG